MQIGELARRASVNIQTVRFYERRKLLPQPTRKPSGYRVYGEADLRRLLFIRQAKELGFSLEEIRDILGMRDRGACPCGRVVSLAQRHLENIRQTIRNLAGFEKELSRAVRKWKNSEQPRLAANEFCTLIERTMEDRAKKVKR
jgi:DNA-binding transcriptional MerR regulator